MVQNLPARVGLTLRPANPLPAMKIFSHMGEVPGCEVGAIWLKSTRQRSLPGAAAASVSWKDKQSKAGRPTDSPERQVPFLLGGPDALQFWACSRARMSPKCGVPSGPWASKIRHQGAIHPDAVWRSIRHSASGPYGRDWKIPSRTCDLVI
jgi:hypothetical protein